MKTEILDAGFEVKAVGATGVFEGYASIFLEPDDARDIVLPGAFARSIRERGLKGIKLLWQHDPREPVGEIETLAEDNRGLFVRARLDLNVRRAREALSLMRIGALDGLSIGFRTVRSRRDKAGGRRLIAEVDLWEVSLVTFPMQRAARIRQFKAGEGPDETTALSGCIQTIRALERHLRDAGGFSRTEAKALAARGFEGLTRLRDADADWAGALGVIQTLKTRIRQMKGQTHA